MCSDIGLSPTPNAKIQKILMDVLHQMHPRRENTTNFKGKVARPTLLAESGEGDTHDPRSLSTKVAPRGERAHHAIDEGPFTRNVRTPSAKAYLGNILEFSGTPRAASILHGYIYIYIYMYEICAWTPNNVFWQIIVVKP